MNQSSDAVFLINEQLTFAYVNDAACRSLGYTREELLTMGPSDIDAVITSGGAKDIMDKQFSNDSYPIFETRHKMRDGRTFPVEIGSSVVEYDGAKFSLTTVRNITERKQAEEKLQERERHSQSLLRLSRNLERSQTYAEVLNAARDEVRNIIGYQNLWAYLLTEDKKSQSFCCKRPNGRSGNVGGRVSLTCHRRRSHAGGDCHDQGDRGCRGCPDR
ncbi:MAG: PAS domain S-box protein [Anaerolineales bacterium]|nr:PAS domain S-box protein [Anaerolineales bacterium]